MNEPKLEVVPPFPNVARWPDGSIAAPLENGCYVTDRDGFIVAISGPTEMMTREQIRERFPDIKIPE